jgi:uridylate kinase
MNYKFSKTIVVALGGSIVHPDGIDTAFLKKFKKFLVPFLRRGKRFILVVGGGRLARRFQDAAHAVSRLADEDKDWIGIHATRLNGHLLRTIFREVADPVMIDHRPTLADLRRLKKSPYHITIAAGWRPGWSTDYVAMQLATDFGAGEAIIAGKPAHAYDKDPSKYPPGRAGGAKPFRELSWRDYRKLIPRKWSPGLHAPVDPVGAALGAREGVRAIIIGGRNLANFAALLKGKDFQGTIIG